MTMQPGQSNKQPFQAHTPRETRIAEAHVTQRTPVIVCFHGSGGNPLPSWDEFIDLAGKRYGIVLFQRQLHNSTLDQENDALVRQLNEQHLNPPFVLVAHSYGGAFAKMFLHRRPDAVAGMLLTETGQEGGLSSDIDESLLNRTVLGDKPLSVIRSNSMISKWKSLQDAENTTGPALGPVDLTGQREFLETCDREDERLKKVQLRLSRNARYVHLPDCGHDVIRERPDVVLQELQWIMANLQPGQVSVNLWTKWRSYLSPWRHR